MTTKMKVARKKTPKKKSQKQVVLQVPSEEYNSIRQEVEKPTAKRALIETRRGNMRRGRRYHLTEAKMATLMEEAQKIGSFPNPYRKAGIYHAIVQGLANLGVNQEHNFSALKQEIQNVLSGFQTKKKENAWDAFVGRKIRNELSGKDVNGRILQNAMVLQRLTGYHLYGEKLRQLCACIDVLKDEDGLPLFRLNTNFKTPAEVKPTNEIRSVSNRGRKKKVVVPESKPTSD